MYNEILQFFYTDHFTFFVFKPIRDFSKEIYLSDSECLFSTFSLLASSLDIITACVSVCVSVSGVEVVGFIALSVSVSGVEVIGLIGLSLSVSGVAVIPLNKYIKYQCVSKRDE